MMLTLLGGKTIVGWCPIQTRREHVLVDKPSGVLLIEAPAMATRSSHDSTRLAKQRLLVLDLGRRTSIVVGDEDALILVT